MKIYEDLQRVQLSQMTNKEHQKLPSHLTDLPSNLFIQS